MALTRVLGDTFATNAGSARGTERTEALTKASTANGGQIRKTISDEQGEMLDFFRAADGVTTGIRFTSPDSTDHFITIANGGTLVNSATMP